jgi:hypothetical protein
MLDSKEMFRALVSGDFVLGRVLLSADRGEQVVVPSRFLAQMCRSWLKRG